jgi:phage virion morphogenesis protein
MIKSTVTLDAERAKATLAALKGKLKNMTPVMKTIGQVVRTSIQKNFELGGRPEGWIRLSPATVAKKRKGGGRILVDSARLKNSIKVQASSDKVVVGTSVIYAAIHHFGGMAGRGKKVKIPARPYMLVQDEDWKEINEVSADYLLREKA